MATEVQKPPLSGRTLFDAPAEVLFRRATGTPEARVGRTVLPRSIVPRTSPLVGVIANGRSHRNRKNGVRHDHWPNVLYASPATFEAMEEALREYAARDIGLLIVNGGDGTLRDVLTVAGRIFKTLPPMAILPSGKTNALALDLGIPEDWTVRDAITAAQGGSFVRRAPIEILRGDAPEPDARGFLLGIGGFVRATELAQSAHRAGAFDGVAVALSLGWSIAQTMFGGSNSPWRAGETIRMQVDGGPVQDRQLYLLLASTLERMPVGLKPFGRTRAGLKLLTINAPPRHMVRMIAPILTGSDGSAAARQDFDRSDLRVLRVQLDGGFILDGERYDGGDLTIRSGEPIRFAAP